MFKLSLISGGIIALAHDSAPARDTAKAAIRGPTPVVLSGSTISPPRSPKSSKRPPHSPPSYTDVEDLNDLSPLGAIGQLTASHSSARLAFDKTEFCYTRENHSMDCHTIAWEIMERIYREAPETFANNPALWIAIPYAARSHDKGHYALSHTMESVLTEFEKGSRDRSRGP